MTEYEIPSEEGDMVYSNWDNQFELTEEEVKQSDKRHGHSAWNFWGTVWYDPKKEKFIEQVKRYRSVVGYYEDESLEDLIDEVNSEYGYN